jgi:hypothetical protein
VNNLYPPRIVQLFTPGYDHEPADPKPTKPGSERKTKKTDTSATSLEDHIAKQHTDAKAKQEPEEPLPPSKPGWAGGPGRPKGSRQVPASPR